MTRWVLMCGLGSVYLGGEDGVGLDFNVLCLPRWLTEHGRMAFFAWNMEESILALAVDRDSS